MAVIGTVTDECVEHLTVFKMTLHVGDPEVMEGLLWAHPFIITCLSVCVGS